LIKSSVPIAYIWMVLINKEGVPYGKFKTHLPFPGWVTLSNHPSTE